MQFSAQRNNPTSKEPALVDSPWVSALSGLELCGD